MTDKEAAKLEPCPIPNCGGEAIDCHARDGRHVCCKECGIGLTRYYGGETAAEVWNAMPRADTTHMEALARKSFETAKLFKKDLPQGDKGLAGVANFIEERMVAFGKTKSGTPANKKAMERLAYSVFDAEEMILTALRNNGAGEALELLKDESWDLRCFPIPTGGGDADIGWRVVGHFMAKPKERTIAEVYQDNPLAAVKAAALSKLEQEGGD